ncbi:MAG: hypothetical protein E6G95_21980 [Alphaproteobacteria bacterium]|jgi:nicotinate-nucleotide--dimethylbenzimidazole phosphoribosyltransferase|nr:MAG: hypothetical protein E6G95_21980 [Alphaproteobacteria bacterium]
MNASYVSPTPTFDEMRRLLRDRHALDYCKMAHRSAKPGHARLLQEIGQRPLRLGEGSGVAVAAPILKAAAACRNRMVICAEAGISENT